MTKLAHAILCQLVAAIWIAAIWVLYCTPACTHPIEHLIAAPVAGLRHSTEPSSGACLRMGERTSGASRSVSAPGRSSTSPAS